MKCYLAVAAAAISVAAFAPAQSATVFTADFETGFGPFAITSGAPIGIRSGSGTYVGCCGAYGSAANLANRFVAFGSNDVANSGSLSTSFATTLGDLYTLNFRYGAAGNQPTQLNFSIDGVTTVLPRNGQLNFDSIFTDYTTTFVGTGSNITLSFSSVGAARSVDAILDDVSVTTGAVPEPASWAMMIAGFGAIGAAMRRRKVAVSFA